MKNHPPGFFSIDRGIFDHPLLQRAEWFRAWEWLIGNAAWKPRGARHGTGIVDLQRGQISVTVRDLATKWGWPKSNVSYFLRALQTHEMIVCTAIRTRTGTRSGTRNGLLITVVTICNYDKFNIAPKYISGRFGQRVGQEVGQETPQLPGIIKQLPSEQAKQSYKNKKERRLPTSRDKPRHGAQGRGMIWFDHGTEEWNLYAEDFRGVHGVEKMPESREGGRGNWFVRLGASTKRKIG